MRFSGPAASVETVLGLASEWSIDARAMDERPAAPDVWVELAIPLAQSSGVDGDQVARSIERMVERLDVEFRLREFLTEIRRQVPSDQAS